MSVGKTKAKQPGTETWAKVKYDHQIIAIAQTNRVKAIYSTDKGIHSAAARLQIPAYGLKDLALPPPKQLPLREAPTLKGPATEQPQPPSGSAG